VSHRERCLRCRDRPDVGNKKKFN